MDAVKEFKKLLTCDLGQIRLNLNEITSLESANQESAKLNQLLKCNILSECEANNLGDVYAEDAPCTPGVDGNKVKTFEELVNIKLQKIEQNFNENSDRCQLAKAQSQTKQFLKKGDGHLRFVNKKITQTIPSSSSTQQLNNDDRFKKKKENIVFQQNNASRAAIQLNLREQCKPQPKFSKIMTVSSNTLNQAIQINPQKAKQTLRFAQKSEKECDPIKKNYNLESAFSQKRIGSEEFDRKMHFLNSIEPINEKVFSTKELISEQEDDASQEAIENANSMRIVQQITQLEKHYQDLMKIKTLLTLENDGESNNDIVSSFDVIWKKIAQLENKVSSISQLTVESEPISLKKGSGDIPNNKNGIHTTDSNLTERNDDNRTTTLSNGDKIKFCPDGSIIYEHANGVKQAVHQDGRRVVQFSNGQTESIEKDGTKRIVYSDGEQRIIKPDHSEKIIFTDGRVCTLFSDGVQQIVYDNGDVEYKTNDFTKRHFKNGNIKTVYASGYNETLYSNGRVRMKDSDGNLLFDGFP